MQNDRKHRDSKEKTKIGFVVLHYGATSVTRRCVSSILQMDRQEQLNIVIVDNDVPSGQENRGEAAGNPSSVDKTSADKGTSTADGTSAGKWHGYADRKNIHILYTGGGKGFSEANNLGYAWLRSQRDFHALAAVVICNNDIVFPTRDFPTRLQDVLARHHADVLGPDIIVPRHRIPSPDASPGGICRDNVPSRNVPSDGDLREETGLSGLHQNPMDMRLRTVREARQTMRLNALALATLPISYPLVNRWLRKMEARREEGSQDGGIYGQGAQKHTNDTTGLAPADQASPVLFGACLIFAENFLQNEEKAFFPETHFYYEEYILAKRCEDAGYRLRYEPSLQVLHESGRATRDDAAHDRKKYIRRKLRNTKAACQVYLSMFR